jgi:pilus assembly protein Flp/PilA
MRVNRQRDDNQEVATTQRAKRRNRSEEGASIVEYALLVALIAIVCIVSLTFFGSSVGSRFSKTASSVEMTLGA